MVIVSYPTHTPAHPPPPPLLAKTAAKKRQKKDNTILPFENKQTTTPVSFSSHAHEPTPSSHTLHSPRPTYPTCLRHLSPSFYICHTHAPQPPPPRSCTPTVFVHVPAFFSILASRSCVGDRCLSIHRFPRTGYWCEWDGPVREGVSLFASSTVFFAPHPHPRRLAGSLVLFLPFPPPPLCCFLLLANPLSPARVCAKRAKGGKNYNNGNTKRKKNA